MVWRYAPRRVGIPPPDLLVFTSLDVVQRGVRRLAEAATRRAFLSAPQDAYVTGPRHLYFQAAPNLTGYMMWGSPDNDDADAIETLITASNERLGPHPTLVDGRALDGPPVLLFERLGAYVRKHSELLRTSVTKLAVIYGAGVSGAVTAGFFSVVKPPYPIAHFESLADALDWLGDKDARTLAAELERIRDASSGKPTLLRQLHAIVSASLPQPDDDVVARALGLSRRTMQRRLAELGTTFSNEVARVRVDRAVLLLQTTQEPLGRIAFDIGCSSVSAFSVLMKKWTGSTPTEIRHRRECGS
jgi:AraC-like DNA-binding protein